MPDENDTTQDTADTAPGPAPSDGPDRANDPATEAGIPYEPRAVRANDPSGPAGQIVPNTRYERSNDPRQSAAGLRVNPIEDEAPAPEPDLWDIGADALRSALEVMRVIRLARHPETRQHLYNLADQHGIDPAEIDASIEAHSPEVARLLQDPAYTPRDVTRPSQYPGVGPSRTPGTVPPGGTR